VDENVCKFIWHLSLTSQRIPFNFNKFLVVQKHITIYNFKVWGWLLDFEHFFFESEILNLDQFFSIGPWMLFQISIPKSLWFVVFSLSYLTTNRIEK
jgi:hypothetical protein